MKRFFLQILSGILGIYFAVKFLPQVEFAGSTGNLVLAGLIFGLLSFFIKPLLELITFPLKILTFGLFGIVLNMGLVWLIDILFPELVIVGFLPLLFTTIILWGVSLFFSFLGTKIFS